ncbi:alpha/beta hydrolase [Mycolicibacterium mengxianglii]|uniref:alpha/beta hydrolase n=1 Tax=Mycolicibacterium mengxianglii TaxID=2736649 RepID=UPI0018D05942|nr:alpha/beta fold hydrolase [Mycolicibacterium mengxianglii]
MGSPPILFLHGVFGRPSLFGPWIDCFTAAGYPCHAVTLPGRDPTDDAVLARTGIDDCFSAALSAYDALGEPAIVIGHSMGGLLGQKLAAARDCAALVLLASAPPGMLVPHPKMVPHLIPLLPAIVAGRPFAPSEATLRAVLMNSLTRAEQDILLPRLVRDSGRVYRELAMGAAATRVKADDVTCPVLCVSAGQDRDIAHWVSRRIATRYRAQHQIHPTLPHWIIAESAVETVAPPVLSWLRRTV